MNTADRIRDLGGDSDCSIMLMGPQTWGEKKPTRWLVTLDLRRDGTKVRVEAEHPDLNTAIETAWQKLERIAAHGLPSGSLLPLVDQLLLDN